MVVKLINTGWPDLGNCNKISGGGNLVSTNTDWPPFASANTDWPPL